MNFKLSIKTALLAAPLIILGVNSQSASAVTLTPKGDISVVASNSPVVNHIPTDWDDLGWMVEGRIGGTRTWEYTIKEYEAVSVAGDPQFHVNWENNVALDWSLDWNGTRADFTIGSNTVSYDTGNSPVDFDGFYLWTRATTKTNKVDPGTNVFFEVDTVNNQSVIPVFSSATSPDVNNKTSWSKNYFSSDTIIISMSGTAKISWDSDDVNPFAANAQSRLGLKIVGFKTPDTSQTTPEPTAIFSLIGIGALGIISKKKG